MNRRHFLTSMPALIAARQTLAAAGVTAGRLGICTFSCHRAWQVARDASGGAPFSDTPTFYDYVRKIGADGVQTSFSKLDSDTAGELRDHAEQTGGYLEGDVRLPNEESELGTFEQEVKLIRAAGAVVARTVLSGTRRYETWKSPEEFKTFQNAAPQRLARVEPILKKHQLRLAVENHKDLTSDELSRLMRQISSEWIGVNVDTGNNLALLEEPIETLETLAPFAMSVHLKDMAVQADASGFQLSEVPCGTGFLDLKKMVAILDKANRKIRFNLEMATRDPLLIPCLTAEYFVTFPERKATHLEAAMQRVKSHRPTQAPPSIAGKPMPQQIAEEESNNRQSLLWMHQNLLLP